MKNEKNIKGGVLTRTPPFSVAERNTIS